MQETFGSPPIIGLCVAPPCGPSDIGPIAHYLGLRIAVAGTEQVDISRDRVRTNLVFLFSYAARFMRFRIGVPNFGDEVQELYPAQLEEGLIQRSI